MTGATALATAYKSISDELDFAHETVRATLRTEHPELEQIDSYILTVRGKMLRPALTLLAGFGAVPGRPHADSLIILAAVFELLHDASLVHDDLLDDETVRRHIPTLQSVFGPHIAVLAGDVLFTSAFALLSRSFSREISEPVITAAADMCHGEILASTRRGMPIPTDLYSEIIGLKTARMMSAACQTGAMVAGADDQTVTKFAEFGMSFGRAYQLLDDKIDKDQNIEESTVSRLLEGEMRSLNSLLGALPSNQFVTSLAKMVHYVSGLGGTSITERETAESPSAS